MLVTRPSSGVTIIGGGLAGVEAAWQLASRGVHVTLVEMRPVASSPAHHTQLLGELVCSNSLKGEDASSAAGCLKYELGTMGSQILSTALKTRVPAGGALAVDRTRFSSTLTATIEDHPLIEVVRAEANEIPEGHVIVASGPLTSPALEPALTSLVGEDRLAFFDAAAPIVDVSSLNRGVIFPASRYDKGGGGDYLNAPMSREQYDMFLEELLTAQRVVSKEFDRSELFAACQPIEEVARTGHDALRFGALKPVGITDPRDGQRPWAVVQLRAENCEATAFNLVGFQTNLTWPEQKRVFSLIPGMENAEFVRYGVMHRNTFIDAPRLLDTTLALRTHPRIRFAGQITGTEGYLEAAASGLIAGINTFADLEGLPAVVPPRESSFGALLHTCTDPERINHQPMHVNFGIIPPLPQRVRGKRDRYAAYAARARSAHDAWIDSRPDIFVNDTRA